MLQMHANHREDIKEARAGDIVALAGLQEHDHRRHAVRSASTGRAGAHGIPRAGHRDRRRAQDQGRPGEDGPGAGAARAPRIPSFRVAVDHESGQTIIKGMGELHLEIIVDRMKREFKVDGQCRRAAGRLSRDHHPGRRGRLHPQEADRRLRPVRARQDALRAAAAGRGLRVRERRGRRLGAARNSSPASRRASKARSRTACSPASR